MSEIQTKNKPSVFALTTTVSKTRATNWVRFCAYISALYYCRFKASNICAVSVN